MKRHEWQFLIVGLFLCTVASIGAVVLRNLYGDRSGKAIFGTLGIVFLLVAILIVIAEVLFVQRPNKAKGVNDGQGYEEPKQQ